MTQPFSDKPALIAKPARLEYLEDASDALAGAGEIALPAHLLGPDGKLKPSLTEAGGLAPTAVFEEHGDSISGYYQGTEELLIDDRKQRLYHFRGDQGEFGVWGSAVLDKRFDRLFAQGLAPGDGAFIVYTHDQDTGRGNPAKMFRVIVQIRNPRKGK